MADRILWPGYSFGNQEHPPSTKYNNILKILEFARFRTGPYSVSALNSLVTGTQYRPQISSFHLKLDDDARLAGLIDSDDIITTSANRSFVVYYISGASNYPLAAWNNRVFTSGSIESNSLWYVALTGGGTEAPGWTYMQTSNPISLSGATAANFIVFRDSKNSTY